MPVYVTAFALFSYVVEWHNYDDDEEIDYTLLSLTTNPPKPATNQCVRWVKMVQTPPAADMVVLQVEAASSIYQDELREMQSYDISLKNGVYSFTKKQNPLS